MITRSYNNADVDTAPVCGDGTDVLVRDITDPAKPADCEFEDPGFDGQPVIAGTPQVGQSLSVGGFTTFGESDALTYEWWACTANYEQCDIVGRDATYTPTAASTGRFISVVLRLVPPASHGSESYVTGTESPTAVVAARVVAAPPVTTPALTAAQQFKASAFAAALAAIPGAKPVVTKLPASLLLFAPKTLKSGVVKPGTKFATGSFGFVPSTKKVPVVGVSCQTSCTVTAIVAVTFKTKRGKPSAVTFKKQTLKVAGAGVGVVTLKPTKAQLATFSKGTAPNLSVALSTKVAGQKKATKAGFLLTLKKLKASGK